MSINRLPVDRLPLVGPTRRRLHPGESIDWHDHDVNQLCYPLRGVLAISTPQGSWVVPPHRAVWIPAGVPHSHRAHGLTEMRSLIFAASVNPLRADRPTVVAADPLLREVIAALSENHDAAGLSTPDPHRPLTPRHRANLEQVALDRLHRVEELPLALPTPRDDRLLALTRLLAADPADNRSLPELGRAVGASDRTLSRLFRTETGLTFPQWRTQLRLHHALTLLAADRPVTAVAAACGFPTPSAFIEAFRKAFGVTPGRYWTAGDTLTS